MQALSNWRMDLDALLCLGAVEGFTVNPIKLETGLRPNGAGTPYTLLFRIEAIGFPTFRLLL